MVFTAVEQRRVQHEKLTEYDTVIAVAHDFPAAFENILRVLPLTKIIAVVNGACRMRRSGWRRCAANSRHWPGE